MIFLAKIYATLIKKQIKTIDDVPLSLKNAVLLLLKKDKTL